MSSAAGVSGDQSPASHPGGLGSFSRPDCVEFMVEKSGTGKGPPPISIIPPTLYTYVPSLENDCRQWRTVKWGRHDKDESDREVTRRLIGQACCPILCILDGHQTWNCRIRKHPYVEPVSESMPSVCSLILLSPWFAHCDISCYGLDPNYCNSHTTHTL